MSRVYNTSGLGTRSRSIATSIYILYNNSRCGVPLLQACETIYLLVWNMSFYTDCCYSVSGGLLVLGTGDAKFTPINRVTYTYIWYVCTAGKLSLRVITRNAVTPIPRRNCCANKVTKMSSNPEPVVFKIILLILYNVFRCFVAKFQISNNSIIWHLRVRLISTPSALSTYFVCTYDIICYMYALYGTCFCFEVRTMLSNT